MGCHSWAKNTLRQFAQCPYGKVQQITIGWTDLVPTDQLLGTARHFPEARSTEARPPSASAHAPKLPCRELPEKTTSSKVGKAVYGH